MAGPNRSHSPEEAVRTQLAALNADESLVADPDEWETVPAAVRTLFDFAAPEYRTLHGSLDAFATALTGPMHDRLLAADAVERGPIDREEGRFAQTVVARHEAGDRTYEFVLAPQSGGKYDGCWMTTAIDLVYDGMSPSFRRMPTVKFGDDERTCEEGATLRSVLLESEGYSPHNDVTEVANCGGNGLCGTCAVEVTGETDDPEYREQKRLELPPHDGEADLRLSCQTCVRGDVEVTKHEGLWGQHIRQAAESDADSIEGNADAEDADGESTDTESSGDETTAEQTATTIPPEDREPDQVVEVAPDGYTFEPETFEISPGDTVHWIWRDGGHNVRVRSRPDGSDWEGTPGGATDTYSEGYLHAFTFETSGEYQYFCAPHQSLGLEGSFTVG